MPCDTIRAPGVSIPERKKQVDRAIDRLNAALTIGEVKVKVGPTGAVAFVGDWEREGVSDVCAFRKLSKMGSAALAKAVQKAEIAAGRAVDAKQVAEGVHSHDGGNTWNKGH